VFDREDSKIAPDFLPDFTDKGFAVKLLNNL